MSVPLSGTRSGRVPLKESLKRFAHVALDPLVRALARAGVRPDHLTFLGLILSLASGLAFALGHFRSGAAFATAAGICDILDGQLARATGHVSRFGAFLDSTLDRIAEAALLVGIASFYTGTLVDLAVNPERVAQQLARGLEPVTWAAISLLAMLALVGSFMVSYTRARAEGLGLECRVGWFERPERMIVLIIAGFAGLGPIMPAALLLLVAFSFATAFQRMAYVWKNTRGAGRDV
ncbi:MAG TPA: CDP-alcohol phosphatidyltransferase family protein [Candidatus Sulfotelmatobacter sp.]|nr:CDP-alcohol phosphatidyltransferase family protein [Candidatus Sulfotelmatobacter sp.]